MLDEGKLNIVFVCFNCGSDICRAINDLRAGKYSFEKIQIYIVDNNSTDNSVQVIQSLDYKNVYLIQSRENLGFGAGCNLGVKHTTGNAPILFLNPDVRLNPDSILNLMDFSQRNPGNLIWGGITCNSSGLPDGKSAWKEPSLMGLTCWALGIDPLLKFFGLHNPDGYGTKNVSDEITVDAVSGCFLLIDAQLFRKLGGFDERFFMYSEEIDLCRRAREIGASPMITSRARLVHIGSTTLTSFNKIHYLYRSKLKYFRKYWEYPKYLAAKVVITIGAILRLLAFTLLSLFRRKYTDQSKIWWLFLKTQLRWGY